MHMLFNFGHSTVKEVIINGASTRVPRGFHSNYVEGPGKINFTKFRMRSPENALIQFRMYQWCMNDFQNIIEINKWIQQWYIDEVNSYSIGKVLRKILRHNPYCTRKGNIRCWKFHDKETLQRGLEYMMYCWLPVWHQHPSEEPITSWAEMLAEYEFISNADYETTMDMINDLRNKKVQSFIAARIG